MKPFPYIEPLESRIAPAFAPVFELSSLDGLNGFNINGVATGDAAGYSVSDAGDVNGDGVGDVIIGARSADPNGTSSGASYVVFSDPDRLAANFDLAALNGSNGFKMSGLAADDRFGFSVSGAGDINGDGFDDIIVGAPYANPNGSNSGASYVIFGKAGGFAGDLDLSTLNGSNGFRVSGVSYSTSGRSVSSAGDVNGDGFDDLIIGAPRSGGGTSYVIFGKATGFGANLNVSSLNGSNGFRLSGEAVLDGSGFSVRAAGDVNGDGFGDVIIGAQGADPNGDASGASYVVFGKRSGFAATVNLSSLNGSNGFKVSGAAAGDAAGRSVSGAGDVNGDGFDDVTVGARGAAIVGNGSGAGYVIFGKASGFAPDLNLLTLDGSNGFALTGVAAGDGAGSSVNGAGDVNGDGFADVIIGAFGADPNGAGSGASYVVFGKAGGFAAILNLSALNGSNGFKVSGVAAGDGSGSSVSAAGDVNGDRFGDLIIGGPSADSNGVIGTGSSYVVFGSSTATLTIGDASVAEGNTGTTDLAFTVTLSAPSTAPVSVRYSTQEDTALAGSDFHGVANEVLTFAAGETSKTVTVQVLGDTTHEADERFSVALSAATNGVTIDQDAASGTGMILNDDAPPQVSITGGSVLEGGSGTVNLSFTVSLSAASGLPATVNFMSVDGTALAGSDYTALISGTLSFAPSEMTKTITVEVLGDTSIEDHESLSVTLSGASGAAIGTGTATGTILNDDTALRIIGPADGLEGDSGTAPFVFTVTLEKRSALPVTVSYSTADGTANAGSDYEGAGPAQLTFAPGETTKSVAISVTGDTEVEAHETFSVLLSAATGAVIAEGAGTGTILNDETLVRITDASLLEGHSGTRTMTFTVSLSAESALPVSVNFASIDGTATAGADYTALTAGTLDFAPGEISKTIAVEVRGDIAVDPGETFSVLLSAADNALIEDDTGVGTILDDDVTLVGLRKATFTDVDGELATIKVSKGTLKVEDFTLFPSGSGAQLALVDLSDEAQFAGANLKISAKKAPGGAAGDKLVNVGSIDATGIDLGKVIVKGDLGQIDAGNDADRKPGVRSLSANSLGRMALATQLPGGSLQSEIAGALRTLKISGDMQDATLSVSGDIGAIAVNGSVLGSAIRSDGKIGATTISGDLAASATSAAMISAQGTLAPVSDAKALAIAALAIAGSIDHAQILAGYDLSGAATNADASIGAVRVGGAWIASSLIAGVTAGPDSLFGTDDDAPISRATSITSKIASILIKGTAAGTEGGADHFGFVAEQIGAFKAGGARLTLTRGPSNDLAGFPVGTTGDLTVREVA